MNRQDFEKLILSMYATRNSNDPQKTAELFADDAVFQLAGVSGPGKAPARAERRKDLHALMHQLVTTWEWLDFEILDLLIDGEKAAVHYRTKQRFIPTNEIVETNLVDLVTLRDGKIAHMVEFCDTALAEKLISAAMTQAAQGATAQG